MTTISEYAGQLIVMRCWCGIQHAVPEGLNQTQIADKERGGRVTPIYCPLGHQHFPAGETITQRDARLLREQRDRLTARLDQKTAELRDTKNRLNATKAAKSRLKNRIANGVCPCCNRHFTNVERHMKTQHPEQFEKGTAHERA